MISFSKRAGAASIALWTLMCRGGGVGEPSVSRSPGPSSISPRRVCFSLVETFGVLLSLFFLKRTSAVGHDVAPRFVSGQLWLASIAKCSCWTTGLMDCDSGRLATVIFLQEIQTQKIYIRSGLLLTTAKGLHRPDPVHQACCRLCI
jgi:hypothetical protein